MDAVAAVLRGTEVQKIASDLLVKRARELMDAIVAEGHYDQMIRDALAVGAGRAIDAIGVAAAAGIVRAVCGHAGDGYTGKSPGVLLEEVTKHLNSTKSR